MDCNSNTAIQKFVARQRELLDLELQAEKEESSVSTGDSQNKGSKNNSHHQEKPEGRRSHVLGHLEASDVSVGLYGRTVVTLTLWSNDTSVVVRERDVAVATTGKASGTSSSLHLLPAHRFTVGNEVELRAKNNGGQTNHKKNKNAMSGVICAVTEASISVAISEDKRSSSPSKGKDKDKGKCGKRNKSNSNNNSNNNPIDPDHDDETSVLDSAPLTLVPRSSIEVHKKLVAAMDRLEKHGDGHPVAGSIIRSVFAAPSSPLHSEGAFKPKRAASATATANQHDNTKTRCFNPGLDASQREAIAFALHPDRPVALIHGPPGTGKTTTVAELIRQAVHHHGMRVLVTAPSNVAVDNILEKLTLSEDGNRERALPALRTVRLGHPARIKPSIAQHGLEALVQSSDGTEIVHDVRRELESHLRSLSGGHRNGTRTSTGSRGSAAKQQNSTRPTPKGRRDKLDRRAIYREIKALRKEVRQREEKVVGELIRSAHVVLATTVGAGNRVLNQITNPRDGHNGNGNGSEKPGFDLVIIDEAAQALEASCWIPILRGRKVVLAGDHCQLPPTIKSNDPKVVEGLGVTLFERLMGLSGKSSSSSSNNNNSNHQNRDISRMLQIQYRMHHKIADWASQAMYHGGLSTHDSVRHRTLGQLDSVRNRKDTNFNSSSEPPNIEEDGDMDLRKTTLMLIDTAGCDLHERETESGSRYNEGEAMLVGDHVRKLLELGVEQNQVAIITPYNGQVELLRNQLLPEFPKLEIRSVDGFQGGEREAVVLSLVRSSDRQGGRNKAGPGIGFLKDDRRQNVAVTRAKRHLAVVCDSETVSQSPFIRNLLQWVGDHGEERSAIEYISESTHSSSHQEYEDDLKVAESELMKLMEEPSLTVATATAAAAATNITKEEQKRKGDVPSIKSSKKPPDVPQKVLEESKRKALMDKIACFVEMGTKGEEMVLSSELSSFDRRLVHEFAEQSGLGHRSEGRENIDRKIILWIQNESPATILGRQQRAAAATSKTKAKDEAIDAVVSSQILAQKEQDNDIASAPKLVSNFLALALDDDDDDSESEISATGTNHQHQNAKKESSAGVTSANSMLAQLARERAERQRQQQQKPPNGPSNTGTSSKKKKKPKGNKLGGPRKPQPPQPKKEDGLDDLDDMAFLDAQIEKSQNTHGRKVAGSGKNYRTVVNGILNSQPESRSKPTNSKANAALRSKLSQAENSRKKKKKKK